MRLSVALTSLLGLAHGVALVAREESAKSAAAAEAAACVLNSAIQVMAGPGDTNDYRRISRETTCPSGAGALSASNICWYLKAISLKFDWLSHKAALDIDRDDCCKYDEERGRLWYTVTGVNQVADTFIEMLPRLQATVGKFRDSEADQIIHCYRDLVEPMENFLGHLARKAPMCNDRFDVQCQVGDAVWAMISSWGSIWPMLAGVIKDSTLKKVISHSREDEMFRCFFDQWSCNKRWKSKCNGDTIACPWQKEHGSSCSCREEGGGGICGKGHGDKDCGRDDHKGKDGHPGEGGRDREGGCGGGQGGRIRGRSRGGGDLNDDLDDDWNGGRIGVGGDAAFGPDGGEDCGRQNRKDKGCKGGDCCGYRVGQGRGSGSCEGGRSDTHGCRGGCGPYSHEGCDDGGRGGGARASGPGCPGGPGSWDSSRWGPGLGPGPSLGGHDDGKRGGGDDFRSSPLGSGDCSGSGGSRFGGGPGGPGLLGGQGGAPVGGYGDWDRGPGGFQGPGPWRGSPRFSSGPGVLGGSRGGAGDFRDSRGPVSGPGCGSGGCGGQPRISSPYPSPQNSICERPSNTLDKTKPVPSTEYDAKLKAAGVDHAHKSEPPRKFDDGRYKKDTNGW